jgi:hypothetical protein
MDREGNAGGGVSFFLRELRTQKSIRARLQRWRSRRWMFSRGDINLDDSVAGQTTWGQRLKWCALGFGGLLLLTLGGMGGILAYDGIRILPCMGQKQCIDVGTMHFLDVCTFSAMPYNLTAQTTLPSMFSHLLLEEAVVSMAVKGGNSAMAKTQLGGRGSEPMRLESGGKNITFLSNLEVL